MVIDRNTQSAVQDVFCCSEDRGPVPVVFVEGFLGRGTRGYWGDVDRYNIPQKPRKCGPARKRRLIYVHLGSVSSLHDRACELYYQLKGGRVDYGKVHSDSHGHGRLGRVYEGLYPQWSSEHPLHFIGHSYGGVTIWYMQQLLIRGYFSTPAETRRDEIGDDLCETGSELVCGNNNGDWVRSLTGISSPFRGTTATYILGEREDEPGRVRVLSFGSALYRLIHLYLYAELPAWIQSYFYDFNVDHWGFGSAQSSLPSLLNDLACSKWAEGRDCAPYDLTMRRMEWVNRRSVLCEKTYYKSFAASMTRECQKTGFHFPMIHPVLPLTLLSYFVGRHSFSSQNLVEEISGAVEYPNEDYEPHWQPTESAGGTRPVPALQGHYDPSDWWENDGLCAVASQLHPGVCSEGYCTCGGRNRGLVTPGMWVTHVMPSTSHVDIVPDVKGLFCSPRTPDVRVAKAEEAENGLFTRLSSFITPYFRPAAGSPTDVRRYSSFESNDDDAVKISRNLRHARVFQHYFSWLAEIDIAEELRICRADHAVPPDCKTPCAV